jgi:S1-C subfamily serine protease
MRHGTALLEPLGPPDAPEAGEPPPGPVRVRRSRPWRRWALAAAVVALVAGGLLAVDHRSTSRPSTSTADVNGIVDKKVGKAIKDLQALPPTSAAVYAAIGPSVVVVQTDRTGAKTGASGLGSGVVIDTQGAVLTSLHVVEGANAITVTFADGTESPAVVKSSDPDHDIAVLVPERLPEVVVPAVLGGGARVGDETFAVGHPLGLVASLSAGVVSGLDRSFPLGDGKKIDGMIQFDAAVNPGSSGGPLLNRAGQVIGIVTGLANPTGSDQFSGIGFAVPIGTAGGAAGAPAR